MSTRVAINGFGRIGRAFTRISHARPELELVAVNDLGNIDNLAYLLKYDSVYGKASFEVEAEEGALLVGGKRVRVVSEADPTKLPWKELGIDLVIEATGFFTSYEKARAHLAAGAKRVVISAPVHDKPPADLKAGTILIGINDDKFVDSEITSNASCTTNAASPLMQILNETLGIEKALLSTTHAYTASQALVDGPIKHGNNLREGRAGAHNIVPSSTGAAIAVTEAIPDLAGRFDGISLRVPVIAGSIADVTFIAKRDTSAEEVNDILRKAAGEERWSAVFSATDEQLVSSDILASRYASIADLTMTRVIGNLVKVLAWYDNEMGYTHSLVEHAVRLAKHI